MKLRWPLRRKRSYIEPCPHWLARYTTIPDPAARRFRDRLRRGEERCRHPRGHIGKHIDRHRRVWT